jgi:hypothetical protein
MKLMTCILKFLSFSVCTNLELVKDEEFLNEENIKNTINFENEDDKLK